MKQKLSCIAIQCGGCLTLIEDEAQQTEIGSLEEVLEQQPDDIREYAADPNLKQKIKATQKENIMETRICHIAKNLGQGSD
ncbi:hypothetical protein TcWFU_005985 [Taenia crassiceps]|uniref:Uncharacterized protein n=1 Tax=Taenia crassiceps TaxID=6207 RepID=A0ABR4QLQ2_9CEST